MMQPKKITTGRFGRPKLSRDGSVLAFQSYSTDLSANVGDFNSALDVFARDLSAGTTGVVSIRDISTAFDEATTTVKQTVNAA